MDGVVAVVKPTGLTSHDVVNRVRRICGVRRVGHAGTLDPIATGVLVICVGQATRILEHLDTGEKEYAARIEFGRSTTTQDRTGALIRQVDAGHITADRLAEVASTFVGSIEQIPPMTSAVHHEGKRLYELARAGKTVDRVPRPVTIVSIHATDFRSGSVATATLRVVCSAGTYIRTLASDIGDALGVGGCMTALERVRSGRFCIARAVSLDDLQSDPRGTLIPIPAALPDIPHLTVGPEEEAELRLGRTIPTELTAATVLVVDPAGAAVAIGEAAGGRLQPRKVLGTGAPDQ